MMEEPKKYKISVVILTFNNQIQIKDCLESAKWADEVVIIDSFSFDKTVEIARQYTDKIWQRPWQGFAAQWNFAIDRASNEWIFILASDEVIPPELKKEIDCVLADIKSANGYFVPRKTFFLGKWIRHCGWYPDYNLRLFKNGCGKYDESELVHETLSLEGASGYLKNPILHYSFSNVDEYVQRLNKYTTLAAQQMIKDSIKIDSKKIKTKAVSKAFKAFWKMYVRQGGFKDGGHGLLLCFFSSIYKFMVYAKYEEQKIRYI